MYYLIKTGAIVLAAFGASLLLYSPSHSETLTWRVKSEYPYVVSLEFYSSSRNHAWPGNGKVWILDDSEIHTYNLRCYSGEKICYGAWPKGDSSLYWGVGQNNRHGCSSCCYTCEGGKTRVMVLNGGRGEALE